MGCYNCKYLKMEDKKDGKTNGSVYYCTKLKKKINLINLFLLLTF